MNTMPLSHSVLRLAALFCLASGVMADTDPSDLCLQAAATASESSGVPYEILVAISVVETGRGQRPWPWTINLGGSGYWLESAQTAEDLVGHAIADGTTNIDIGCFQLNYRWHAGAFASVEEMLDPVRNAQYAAEFLATHYDRTGDWGLAAGAYHSVTPEHADRYIARFNEALTDLAAPTDAGTAMSEPPRENGFPLLIAREAGRNGSLVPTTAGGLRLIGTR